MKKQRIIKNLLQFYIEAEKLKTVMRHSYTSNNKRMESSADHSWMVSLIAITLFHHLTVKVDQLKVLKLVIIHDLAESITSDIPPFEISKRQENKKLLEKKAFEAITKQLDSPLKKEMQELFTEYEMRETVESKLAQALDKMEATIQHNIADIETWDQGDLDIHPFHRYDYFDFDIFLKEFRNGVEVISREKITKANMLNRLKPQFQKIYNELNEKDGIK